MNFLETVVAILQNKSDRPESSILKEEDLITLSTGTLLGKKLPKRELLKVLNLQTLCYQEEENGRLPKMGTIELCKNSELISVQEDAGVKIAMLERIIVEIVREAIPSENERFGVRYCINRDGELIFSPLPRYRSMD